VLTSGVLLTLLLTHDGRGKKRRNCTEKLYINLKKDSLFQRIAFIEITVCSISMNAYNWNSWTH